VLPESRLASSSCLCWQPLLRQMTPQHCQHIDHPVLQHFVAEDHVLMGAPDLSFIVALVIQLPPSLPLDSGPHWGTSHCLWGCAVSLSSPSLHWWMYKLTPCEILGYPN
jgi:hypothetical protein